MKTIITALLLVISFNIAAQDSMVIPKGIVYKKAGKEVNDNAKKLLLQELNDKTVTYALYNGMMFIGPSLWKRLKVNEDIAKINAGNVQFKVPVTDTVTGKVKQYTLDGKLIQTKDDFKIVWKQIVTDVVAASPVFRKMNSKELTYYWAIINFDIEEPVWVVETGSYNLLVQFVPGKTSLFWLEEL